MFLDFKQMVAEIQDSKAPLLPKKYNDHTASPVESIAKALPRNKNNMQSTKNYKVFYGSVQNSMTTESSGNRQRRE